MKKFFIATLVSLLFVQAVYAISLDEAKSKGAVGETQSGYLEAVSNPGPNVSALIAEINAKRHAEYESIAQKNGTTVQAVELLAGKKAIEKAGPGTFAKVGGNWVKK